MDPSARLEKATPSRQLYPVKAKQILVRKETSYQAWGEVPMKSVCKLRVFDSWCS